MLGGSCSPCCSAPPLYAITLAGMENVPWTRTMWHPDDYNATFAPLNKTANSFQTITCGLGTPAVGPGVVIVANSSTTLTTPIRIQVWNTCTSNRGVAHPTRANTMFRIVPADPFDPDDPQWNVFEELTDNINAVTVGTLFPLPGVSAYLWTEPQFDPSEHQLIVSPPISGVTAGGPISRFCGFTNQGAGFGPFDLEFSLSVFEHEPQPAEQTYLDFLAEVQEWVQNENQTLYTTPETSLACAETTLQGFPAVVSANVSNADRYNPTGIGAARGYLVQYAPAFPSGWLSGSSVQNSASSWGFFNVLSITQSLSCRGPFGQKSTFTYTAIDHPDVRVGKFLDGPGWVRVTLRMNQFSIVQS